MGTVPGVNLALIYVLTPAGKTKMQVNNYSHWIPIQC